jgi:hypothetical protein
MVGRALILGEPPLNRAAAKAAAGTTNLSDFDQFASGGGEGVSLLKG